MLLVAIVGASAEKVSEVRAGLPNGLVQSAAMQKNAAPLLSWSVVIDTDESGSALK
ncbi:hypothetical protein ACX0MV_04205 [Pseudomonas borbori]